MPEVPPGKDDKDRRPPSALNVVPGVAGGHDGLPGGSGGRETLPGGGEAGGRGGEAGGDQARGGRPARREPAVAELAAGVLAGDRTLLGRAVTLIESNAPAHQERAQDLLRELLPRAGGSIRVGVTGVPGAGKSTLVEALGCHLTAAGHQVAVLAVDPSSSRTRGSILGDKTRMEKLARDARAFIRPSPSGGSLGGVARKTRETMLLFEAAGYDVILVETVGVGQSEAAVRSMVDFFLLVLIAGAGDELQGIKRGVMELADAVLVNKADRDNRDAAERARADLEMALHYMAPATPGWTTEARAISALTGEGIGELWELIETFRAETTAGGAFDARRREQAREWLHAMLRERVEALFHRDPRVAGLLPEVEAAVMSGDLPVTQAAWRLLHAFENGEEEP